MVLLLLLFFWGVGKTPSLRVPIEDDLYNPVFFNNFYWGNKGGVPSKKATHQLCHGYIEK